MFDENFTFDQKGVADTSRRDAVEPESAMSPKEVHADLPPPPPSLEAAKTPQSAAATSKEAATTPAESDTIDSLARQLGRQTLLQEDPQYQWRRSQQPPTFLESSAATAMPISPIPPAAAGAPSAARQSTTFADTGDSRKPDRNHDRQQLPVQRADIGACDPGVCIAAIVFPAGGSCSSSSSGTTNLDGDTLMTDRNRSIQVDQDWGDDEPMVRLLSYRRAGAMTRVQKLGLSFRSAQHTALQCANLKPNKTRMRRRDRKPSKAQPTPTPMPMPTPATMPAPPGGGRIYDVKSSSFRRPRPYVLLCSGFVAAFVRLCLCFLLAY
ncbi:hypothetical protein PG997_004391 [Apiospora hydei]|uniref:Uncharacterized protein n=1 Tax=Apiospora hydei TaxID=1337664 RepID=A0ABR1X1Z5_9PEZI